MEVSVIIAALTPIIVFLAAQTVKLITKKIPDLIFVIAIVPLLSLLVTFLSDFALAPDAGFWYQFGYALSSVFIFETYKKLKRLFV